MTLFTRIQSAARGVSATLSQCVGHSSTRNPRGPAANPPVFTASQPTASATPPTTAPTIATTDTPAATPIYQRRSNRPAANQLAVDAAVLADRDLMRQALSEGADINHVVPNTHGGPLIAVVLQSSLSPNREGVIDDLMRARDTRGKTIDLSQRNGYRENVMHAAARSDNARLVTSLLRPLLTQQNGHRIEQLQDILNARNEQGRTPQQVAMADPSRRAAEYALGRFRLMAAQYRGGRHAVDDLRAALDCRNGDGQNALEEATARGDHATAAIYTHFRAIVDECKSEFVELERPHQSPGNPLSNITG